MTAARIDRETVLDGLRVADVIAALGLQGRQHGAEFRTRQCPRCGTRSRDSVAINLATGLWHCHVGECGGDILDLVATLCGLDAHRDFPAVLARAAELAGVSPSEGPPDPSRRIERERLERERQEREAVEERRKRAAAIAMATPHWDRLARRSPAGEAYLASRGLADAIARQLVRFEPDGSIAVALRTADDLIVNVVRRRLPGGPPDAPKVLGLKGCPTRGTMVGALASIVGPVTVILVEGLADALTAAIGWPGAVVLGAHGAGRMELIGQHAARRVKIAGGRLWLGCHADEAGERAAIAAGLAAKRIGLVFERDLFVIDHGDTPDLNDAWRAGWRPR